jgi:hypothetical protein
VTEEPAEPNPADELGALGRISADERGDAAVA